MKRLALLALLSVAACTEQFPAGSYPVDAAELSRIVLASYGHPDRELPPVWLVPDDPKCAGPNGERGFVNPTTGTCHAGMVIIFTDLFVLEGALWSRSSLAHELAHWAGWSHDAREQWAGAGQAEAVERARALIAARPDLDHMPVRR